MMQFIMIICSLTVSIIFMQMKHPLSMGIMLLIQTTLICFIIGSFSKTFWFSYVLFLIFLGGMLVLFIYVTSLASNEMFSLSMKMILFSTFTIITMMMMLLMIDISIINSFLMNSEMIIFNNKNNYLNENTLNLNKLYNFPTNMLTLILINYLFLTLIAVVKITNNFYGSLRQKI
nr:NADH dehydrogenase subunit 6 [Pseudolimnophila brunneinota]